MNLNYAIFRSEPIMTLNDLAQIWVHNKREKKEYNSNPDINIELVPLADKYVKGFIRTGRKRSFKGFITKRLNIKKNTRKKWKLKELVEKEVLKKC